MGPTPPGGNTSKIIVKVGLPPVAPGVQRRRTPSRCEGRDRIQLHRHGQWTADTDLPRRNGSLPASLKLSSGGVLAGTPTNVATHTFSVKETNSAGTATTEVVTNTTSKRIDRA